VSRYSFRGKTVQAGFQSYDASGCVETDAYLVGSLSRSGGGGSPGGDAFAYLAVSQYDYCTGAWMYADGSTSQLDLQVGHKLDAASLTATIPVYDYSTGATRDLSVNVAWTATGDATSAKNHYVFRSSGLKAVSNFSGEFRPAEASGSISDGVTNFAPSETYYAEIDNFRSGSVVIERSR
jgi:hypothetical protein